MNAARLAVLAPERATREADDTVESLLRLMEAVEGLSDSGWMTGPEAGRWLGQLRRAVRTTNEIAAAVNVQALRLEAV